MKGIIVVDLDGTLLRDDGTMSEYTKKVLLEASRQYILIAATGRTISGVKKALDYLFSVFSFSICCNGAIIYEKDRVIKEEKLTSSQVNSLYNIAKQYNVDFRAISDCCETNKKTEQAYIEANKNSLEICVTEVFHPAYKAVMTSEKNISHVMNILENVQLPVFSFTKSDNHNIDFGTKGVSKGSALSFIREKYKLLYKNVTAFGDAENDITMLERSDNGVAMANAQDNVKEAAEFMTKYGNNDDGVAKFIDHFLLRKHEPKILEDIRNLDLMINEGTQNIFVDVEYDTQDYKLNMQGVTNRNFELMDNCRINIEYQTEPEVIEDMDNIKVKEITITQIGKGEIKLAVIKLRGDLSISKFTRYIVNGKKTIAEETWEENNFRFLKHHEINIYDSSKLVSDLDNEWKKIKDNLIQNKRKDD